MRAVRNAGRFLLLVTGIALALAAAHASAQGIALNAPLYVAEAGAAAPGVPALPDSAQPAPSRTRSAYDSIAVVQPANDTTVFDNAGNVDVTIAVSPELDTRAGDRVALVVDGRRTSVQAATQFKLFGITRGEHILEAQIVDRSGNTVISSDPVKFHLWQASRLFPGRRGK